MLENGNHLATLKGENEGESNDDYVFICEDCQCKIFEGDYYYEIGNAIVCEYCIENYKQKAR